MAMEDAVVLAGCLRARDSIPEAFADYESLRRSRVERIVAHGARTGSTKTPGPVGRLVRDVMLKAMFRFLVTEKSLAWMYDYRVSLAGAASLHAQAA
jgi:2-polyprenyl-6-methoxyphenol hydroxylase-like FAD-dependent oxidoreductase